MEEKKKVCLVFSSLKNNKFNLKQERRKLTIESRCVDMVFEASSMFLRQISENINRNSRISSGDCR